MFSKQLYVCTVTGEKLKAESNCFCLLFGDIGGESAEVDLLFTWAVTYWDACLEMLTRGDVCNVEVAQQLMLGTGREAAKASAGA